MTARTLMVVGTTSSALRGPSWLTELEGRPSAATKLMWAVRTRKAPGCESPAAMISTSRCWMAPSAQIAASLTYLTDTVESVLDMQKLEAILWES
jgi:hypothetical protein